MKYQFSQSILAIIFTLCLFSISQSSVQAAPGNLGHIPLFIAPPVQPNIFFMLDDSGSMRWNLTVDGDGSSSNDHYDKTPNNNDEWRTWCRGSNVLAYNPDTTYKPWAGNQPGTDTPYPDQNLTSAWAEATTAGVGNISSSNTTDSEDTGRTNLSNAPIIEWVDADGDGVFDESECPTSDDERVTRANALTADEKTNFANWFTYYRNRDRTVTAALTQVIANSSARMGMATLHHNNGVGVEIKDMTVEANKNALLAEVANIDPNDGTPLRTRLNWVGEYFDTSIDTPSGLNIGSPSSPILSAANGGECQQNFVMLMTDGARNGDPAGVDHQDQDTADSFVFNAHQDDVPDTLADIAMKWYKNDLATELVGKVPIQKTDDNQLNIDENNQQHLVTLTVAFGLSSLLSDPPDRNTAQSPSWPSGTFSSADKLEDLRHAAYNGRGKFLSAANPEELVSSLQNIISSIESRQGSASAVAFNTSTLLTGTSLYFASFDPDGWTGDVVSFSVNTSTGQLSTTSSSWSAADELNNKSNAEMLSQTVYTWGVVDSTGINNGVLFDWRTTGPQPVANILNDFKINWDLSVEESPFSFSPNRLDFVRGDTRHDGGDNGLIRDRKGHRLGDIIHSSPRFVGAPVSNWPDNGDFGIPTKRYSAYQSATSDREGVVYVGANDGLLHGFRASNGEQVLAYLPSAPSSELDNEGLHYFTESDYQHRYYVDGSPVSADVYIPIVSSGASDWRTILVGALGGGGQGLYALDVSNPNQFENTQTAAKNTVLWEFTNQDDDHLGFTFSTPQVTMMNNGQWAVIIGNGYNATGTDTAELKILFIEKGLDGEWATAGDYITIDTKKGSNGNKNGLSTPTLVDLDDNGTTDRIYAGDLLGNMWAFDVSNETASNWGSAYLNGSDPDPLFAATSSQPITMKPLIVKPDVYWIVDDTSNTPNLMVYFGTGQFIATGDAVNTNQQAFYGIWDGNGVVPASKLVEQTFVTGVPIDARVVTQNTMTLPTPPSSTTTATQLGWFINLPESGERVVVNAFTHQGLVYFNTMTPSSLPCSAGGESWLMAVDMKTGGNPGFPAFDVDGDGNFDNSDQVSDGSTDHHAAGVKFGFGLASATSVMTNENGQSFAFTSGTDAGSSDIDGEPPPPPKPDVRKLPPAPNITGLRRSWIQLFN